MKKQRGVASDICFFSHGGVYCCPMSMYHPGKNRVAFFVLVASLLSLSCAKREPAKNISLSVTDGLGRTISFEQFPRRVVSLAPSLTEMCFAIDSGVTLVGVTDYCNYPAEARRKPSVGGMLSPNFERIADLQPDLILATVEGNSKEDVTKLESLGYRLFITNPRSIPDIFSALRSFGKILQRDSASNTLTARLENDREAIHQAVLGVRNPRVFAVISVKPLMSASAATFIGQLITEAGGINIAENTVTPYPIFNREEIVHRQPDLIVVTSDAANSTAALLAEFPEWRMLNAVKKGRILIIDSDIITRPGPRIVQGLEILARALHPGILRDHRRKPSPRPLQIGTR